MAGHGEGTARLPRPEDPAPVDVVQREIEIFCSSCGRVIVMRPGQERVICKGCGTVNHA